MEAERKPFESWAILEIMGHRQYAGRVTEEQIGGTMLLRIDIPTTSRSEAHTKYVGAGSIFAMHPCTEDIAVRAAERIAQQYGYAPIPIHLPNTPALNPGPSDSVGAQLAEDDVDGIWFEEGDVDLEPEHIGGSEHL